ncbi:MAG: nuclear transport factor 2 family protein [Devosia sp.]
MPHIADPKAFAKAALKEIFTDRDPAAIDRYIAAPYTQHNPMAYDGPDGLRGFVGILPAEPKVTVKTVRALVDGEFIALHSIYEGFGPEPTVGFDVWRMKDGKLVEHWDCLSPATAPNPSGHTQTDGATEITDRSATEANRALVTRFIEAVLVGGDFAHLDSFINATTYIQHNSQIADGLSGLGAAVEAMGKQGIKMAYSQLHRTIAEGNFVLAQSEGTFGGTHTAFYDLFRIEAGRIVEHWDVLQTIPEQMPHGNGMF